MMYDKLVRDLKKDPREIVLSNKSVDLVHMALGLAGEAGEVVDLIKKHFAYNKVLDVDLLVEELGDVEFYLEGIRQAIGVGREEVIKKNMEKLMKRYPDGYSDQAALKRADYEQI